MASPLEMYSNFSIAYQTLLDQILKLIGKWPMAYYYFKLGRVCVYVCVRVRVHVGMCVLYGVGEFVMSISYKF